MRAPGQEGRLSSALEADCMLRRFSAGPLSQLTRWKRGMSSATSGSYSEAIAALNTLQSNAAIIEAIRRSGGKLNDLALPEMVEYLERIGWKVRAGRRHWAGNDADVLLCRSRT